jgi:hypothetical protein
MSAPRSHTARALRFFADLASAQVRSKAPFKLTYVVTDDCSCRCAICALWQAPRSGAPLEDIERLFTANPELAWINLSGGDVVERDDFEAIVAAAVERTRVYVLDFPTAGQHPERVERAVRSVLALPLPRLVVTVSIDGPKELHDRLRGTPGAFERARETFMRLSALRGERFDVFVGMTFSSRNDAAPAALVDATLAQLPGVERSRLHFNLAHHAPHYYRKPRGRHPRRAAHDRVPPRRAAASARECITRARSVALARVGVLGIGRGLSRERDVAVAVYGAAQLGVRRSRTARVSVRDLGPPARAAPGRRLLVGARTRACGRACRGRRRPGVALPELLDPVRGVPDHPVAGFARGAARGSQPADARFRGCRSRCASRMSP